MKSNRQLDFVVSRGPGRNLAGWFTLLLGLSLLLAVQASAQAPSPATMVQTFPVGNAPLGVVSAGADIWVANSSDNTVTKLRAADGALLGTFPTGSLPVRLAFDGNNIWVTNNVGATVTKLRESDGALQGTFGVGSVPVGIVFDGTNIWVANNYTNNVTK